ncbi:MAG: helix-turn-helix domain-containing protein [Methylococcaceae bacterium]
MNNQENTTAVINRIEQVLEEKGLTNPDFQEKLGIQSQHWNNWKNRGVPSKQLFVIAIALGVNTDWLATGKGNKYTGQDAANAETGLLSKNKAKILDEMRQLFSKEIDPMDTIMIQQIISIMTDKYKN